MKKIEPTKKKYTPSQKRPQNRWKAYGFLLLNTICWGAALPLIKPALDHTTPFRYLFYRFLCAGILAIPFLIYYWPQIRNHRKILTKITAIEMLGTSVALGLLYTGLNYTTALEASLLATTTPIFTVLAGIWFLSERQEKNEWLGLFLAFGGALLTTLSPLFYAQSSSGDLSTGLIGGNLLGNTFIIAQNIATAGYLVLAKKHYQGLPKLFVTSVSFWVGTFSFLAIAALEYTFQASASETTTRSFISQITFELQNVWVLGAVFYGAIVTSIIGLTAYIKGQEYIEASEANLFFYLQPVVFVPLSILLKDTFHWSHAVALLLILTGVFVAENRSSLHVRPSVKKLRNLTS